MIDASALGLELVHHIARIAQPFLITAIMAFVAVLFTRNI